LIEKRINSFSKILRLRYAPLRMTTVGGRALVDGRMTTVGGRSFVGGRMTTKRERGEEERMRRRAPQDPSTRYARSG